MLDMQAVPSSMGLPAQPMPQRPSQRDAAPGAQGKPAAKPNDDDNAKGSTLRQSYAFLSDPEKRPSLVDTSSSGDSAASCKAFLVLNWKPSS